MWWKKILFFLINFVLLLIIHKQHKSLLPKYKQTVRYQIIFSPIIWGFWGELKGKSIQEHLTNHKLCTV